MKDETTPSSLPLKTVGVRFGFAFDLKGNESDIPQYIHATQTTKEKEQQDLPLSCKAENGSQR
ncbi:hypothetical protein CVT26_006919 [Gymnopilus dilepis]|uniref:Uncharacterized protein n=1 Tax=Gymnopilus dilepis TaxID=231916 RepID=A0A409W6C5_9AGAR|nr:hypothetical protein CVT26_006919 [Gymnopilus dilepis]